MESLFLLVLLFSYLNGYSFANQTMECEEIVDESLVRSGTSSFWPGGRVPYELVNLREQDMIPLRQAIDNYHRYTCIRFEPRTSSDRGYAQFKIMFENKGICGSATVCYRGEPQTIHIAHDCSNVGNFVHEMGHSLCLRHEHQREDRDQYLDFSKCDKPGQITPPIYSDVTRGNLYDYLSKMHYPCSACHGLPKLSGVTKCSNDIGLSVMDAEKLNLFYNCQGCFRHRWYRVDTLTSAQESTLANVAIGEADNEPIQLCRGYIKGTIFSGKYLPQEKACLLGYEGRVFKVTKDIQVFGLPNGPNSVTAATTAGYHLVRADNVEVRDFRVHVAGVSHGSALHSVVAQIAGDDDKKITLAGFTHQSSHLAVVATSEKEIYLPDPTQFYVMVCK